MLVVIDEFTRECLAIELGRSFTSDDLSGVLQYLFAIRGVPEHIRSDNSPEFVAKGIRRWLVQAGVSTLFIPKSSPWENGYVEAFNGKFRDELLNGELFLGLADVRRVIERCRLDDNHRRPHSALGYQSPAAFAANCVRRIPLRFIDQDTERPLTRNSLIRSGARLGGRSRRPRVGGPRYRDVTGKQTMKPTADHSLLIILVALVAATVTSS